LEQWSGNSEVAGSNPACCYISAIGEEGTGLLANHLKNGSGLDKQLQVWMVFLKPALWQYTSVRCERRKDMNGKQPRLFSLHDRPHTLTAVHVQTQSNIHKVHGCFLDDTSNKIHLCDV